MPNGTTRLIILFTVFLDVVGFGILIPPVSVMLGDPTSPLYLLGPRSDPKRGYVILGYLIAIYPFCQFLATPVPGQLSDRFGRKPTLALAVAMAIKCSYT